VATADIEDDIEDDLAAPGVTRAALHDVLGGGVCSVLQISYCLSYAALIFSGPLVGYLGDGISMTFLSAAVLGIVVALGSAIPTMIGGPDSSTSAMVAAIAAVLAERVAALNPSADLLLTIVPMMAALAGITGLFMIVLARLRGGRAMRYVPYPVISGFLGATGWLIVSGAFRVVTGHRLALDDWSWTADTNAMLQLLAGTAFAAVIAVATRYVRTAYVLPLLLIGGVIAAHLAFVVGGMSMHDAQLAGWTFAPQQAHAVLPLWSGFGSIAFPWRVVPDIAGDAIAAVLVTAVSALVNVTALEVATNSEADLERELRVVGLANLAAAAAGGYIGAVSTSRTMLNQGAGARGRLSGIVVALIAAIAVVAGPGLIGYLPKFVLGALLIYLGADQLYRWVVVSWSRLSRIEYIALLAIILITIRFGFVAGLIIGTVIGCATFAYSASRINSIKYEFDGFELRSTLDRDRDELAVLAERGREILGLNLQSYLFFGSANRLYRHIKDLLETRLDCRYLVFDFGLVTGIDSSAVFSFTQIKRFTEARGIRLVFVNVAAAAEKALRAEAFVLTDVTIMGDLDRALEWCENEVIRQHQLRSGERGDLINWFAQALGDRELADQLLARCRRIEVPPDAVIVTAGDAANSMYFIGEGRVAVMVSPAAGQEVRIRSLGRHTMVGEMGLLAAQPRSATLRAEVASVLYELDAASLAVLRNDNPVLVEKLLRYVVAVMAERLAFANRTIGLLRR
jgi:SulP family sulfate permease